MKPQIICMICYFNSRPANLTDFGICDRYQTSKDFRAVAECWIEITPSSVNFYQDRENKVPVSVICATYDILLQFERPDPSYTERSPSA